MKHRGSAGAKSQGALRFHLGGIAGSDEEVAIRFVERIDVMPSRHRLRHEERGVRVTDREFCNIEPEIGSNQPAQGRVL